MQGHAGRVRYLDEAKLRFAYAPDSIRLRCELEDEVCLPDATIRRLFPLTNPSVYVSIHDGSGKELGVFRSIDRLEPDSREIVEAALDRRYFTPEIREIVSLKQEASMWRWEVETNRGRVGFYLRGVRDSIHEVGPGRWQVYTVDGQRYEIKDFTALDPRSQNLFESLF